MKDLRRQPVAPQNELSLLNILNYITFPSLERCSNGAKIKNDGNRWKLSTVYPSFALDILQTMERQRKSCTNYTSNAENPMTMTK